MIDPALRDLFTGISPTVRRLFRSRRLLPQLDPDLCEAMRAEREESLRRYIERMHARRSTRRGTRRG